MSKKVLVISSSPRKGGNSDTLCDKFIQGALDAGNQVEKIFLKDKNINYCSGCGFCNSNSYSKCSQKDDMEEILDKMTEADVIVLATPIYFYTMSGQMKTFIDRCCSRYTKITNKEFYYIMSAADVSQGAFVRTVEEFRGFLACLSYAREKGILCAAGVWQKVEVDYTKYIQEACDMGKNV